jgi:hypothetical protein
VRCRPCWLIYSCNATNTTPSVFYVNSIDRWASLNFILSASVQTPMVSIDDHDMWVYAADGHFVQPQHVDGMLIYSGQRYSALVRLKDKPRYDVYTMRVSNVGGNQILVATALLSYTPSGKIVTTLLVSLFVPILLTYWPLAYYFHNHHSRRTGSESLELTSNTQPSLDCMRVLRILCAYHYEYTEARATLLAQCLTDAYVLSWKYVALHFSTKSAMIRACEAARTITPMERNCRTT